MRRLLVLVVALILAVLTAAPAAADGPPTVIGPIPFVFADTNPCTGVFRQVNGTFTAAVHDFDNGQRHHANVHVNLELESVDGFSGGGVETIVANDQAATGQAVIRETFNVQLTNDAGQRIKAHGVMHLTLVDFAPVAFVAIESAWCAGKPA